METAKKELLAKQLLQTLKNLELCIREIEKGESRDNLIWCNHLVNQELSKLGYKVSYDFTHLPKKRTKVNYSIEKI